MNIKHLLPLQRIIGKIDNDFNIDHSDWIPRVAAWTIDALGQMRCTPYSKMRVRADVDDNNIAHIRNVKDIKNIVVYNKQGCVIDNLTKNGYLHTPDSCKNEKYNQFSSDESNWTEEQIGLFTGDEDVRKRIRVGRICFDHTQNFVIVSDDTIQLNFSTDYVVVEYFGVATYYDEYFDDEVPYVYDNALLLEAIAWYCMMKILQRGYKHQVFSLSGPEPVNPYLQWNKIKDQAAASVRKDLRDTTKNEGWNNFFYNSTFLPRL